MTITNKGIWNVRLMFTFPENRVNYFPCISAVLAVFFKFITIVLFSGSLKKRSVDFIVIFELNDVRKLLVF